MERLGLPFECIAPQTDEQQTEGESAENLCTRLARMKAQAVARSLPDAIVIGSDQVAVHGQAVLGKPGTFERCVAQLLRCSARQVEFLTAVHVIDGPGRRDETHLDRTVVRFRELDEAEVRRYVRREQPLDCAGGFKVEKLGIALFEQIDSQDPTGLTGLPLIWLCGALRRAGLAVP
jgi:septum formation protein